jgi:hypothetical protein
MATTRWASILSKTAVVKLYMHLTGGVDSGLQEASHSAFRRRLPGHAVYAVGYDQNFLTVLTWGNTQQATWSWWDECVDEAYAILPPEAKDPKFAPGFNLAQLQADLAAVAN